MQQLVINHKAIKRRLRAACQNDLIQEQCSFFITVILTSLHSVRTTRQPAYRHQHGPLRNETPGGATDTRASVFSVTRSTRQKLTDASRSERSAPSAPRRPDAGFLRQYVHNTNTSCLSAGAYDVGREFCFNCQEGICYICFKGVND